jgi:hypothetical protein
MSTVVRGLKTRYVPESPERVKEILYVRQERLQRDMPQFLELYRDRGISGDIRRYEGMAAVRSAYEQLISELHPGDDYLILSDLESWYSLSPELNERFIVQRSKLSLKIRMLTTVSDYSVQRKGAERRYKDTIRFLPRRTNLTTNLVILPHKVLIHELLPPISATVIESRSTVQMHREIFELLWMSASEVPA